MRKFILLLLVFVLAACGASPATPTEAPTQEIVQPTQTPIVIVNTVVVTVVPTNVPTEIPSASPLPSPTAVPPTPTQPPATQPPAETAVVAMPTQASIGGLTTLDAALGGGYFNNITLSANTLTLRCQTYKDITFTVAPANTSITQVDFYYRMEDRGTGAIFDWVGPRRMLGDGQGNFTLTFAGSDVNENFRKPNAWFDFQFIGLNRSGGHVGNSAKIVQQVTYTFDCP